MNFWNIFNILQELFKSTYGICTKLDLKSEIIFCLVYHTQILIFWAINRILNLTTKANTFYNFVGIGTYLTDQMLTFSACHCHGHSCLMWRFNINFVDMVWHTIGSRRWRRSGTFIWNGFTQSQLQVRAVLPIFFISSHTVLHKLL